MRLRGWMSFYSIFNDVLVEEPEVRQRLKELLDEITIDEVPHVGQRKNLMGPLGMNISKALDKPFYTLFFYDIPEIKQLFDVKQLIKMASPSTLISYWII